MRELIQARIENQNKRAKHHFAIMFIIFHVFTLTPHKKSTYNKKNKDKSILQDL